MTTGYVHIPEHKMRELLEQDMGFTEEQLAGTRELVFERQVNSLPYYIRVYSSVIPNAGSRGVGKDAIRVVLVHYPNSNAPYNRMLKVMGEGLKGKAGKRIHRTQNALKNLRERCRDYWRYVRDHRCGECDDGLLVPRQGKHGEFLGCTNYPECKNTG